MTPRTKSDSRWLLHAILAIAGGSAAACVAPSRRPDAPAAVDVEWGALRSGLARSQAMFAASGRGRVAFLGGSITYNPGWREQVCAWLQQRWPGVAFDFVAAGIPSMGSTPGAFRLARDVLARGPVDLLFVEAAVNDSTNGRSDVEQVRAMEGIVRHARAANPAIDVVFLHFADPDKIAAYDRGEVPAVIRNHERVAVHYGVPSLDLAREVRDRIARGEFTWRDDFKDLHPSPFGQRLYAAAVERLLQAAWGDGAGDGDLLPVRPVPPPLDPACYQNGILLAPDAAAIGDGFERVASWHNDVGGGTRGGFADVPMLVGQQPGATCSLAFRGHAVGIFVAAGPDAGIVEYRVDDAPWQRRDLFTPWSANLHLPWLYLLAAGLPRGDHRLDLRIAPEHAPTSRGTACRIAWFAVDA